MKRFRVVPVLLVFALFGCGDSGTESNTQPDPFMGCSVARIGANSTQAGTLTTSDCFLEESYVDFYELDLGSTTSLTIDAMSDEFDTILVVLDRDSGNEIAFDDDSGAGLNSRIIATFSPGTYIIAVAGYSDSDLGTYTVQTR